MIQMSIPLPSAQLLELRLCAVTYAADATNLYEFRPLTEGEPLPAFTAGAHVDLHLPNGLVRQYSLLNAQSERDRYVLGIKRDPASRGGSNYVHDNLRVGQVLKLSAPRNHFALVESGAPLVLIAGGIGVTPLFSMAERAHRVGLEWSLHYSVRRRSEALLLRDLRTYGDRVALHVDEAAQGRFLDLEAIVAGARPDAHLYCCGPTPMLDAFEAAAAKAGFPDEQVHVERFSAEPVVLSTEAFVVELAASDKSLSIGPGQSILEVARAAGVPVEASCEQGICGACETTVLSGVPDHRDKILSKQERASGRTMMICCSGSLTEKLVLDL